MTNTPASVAVVQADRVLFIKLFNVPGDLHNMIHSGKKDSLPEMQAIARHRLAFQQPGGEVWKGTRDADESTCAILTAIGETYVADKHDYAFDRALMSAYQAGVNHGQQLSAVLSAQKPVGYLVQAFDGSDADFQQPGEPVPKMHDIDRQQPGVDALVDHVTKALYDAAPHKVISPALSDVTGPPIGEVISYEIALASGFDVTGLRRHAVAAIAALKPAPDAALREALTWLNEQRNVEIAYYRPVYCDDDDEAEEWRVFRVNGSINDREWSIIGRGQTFEEALSAATPSQKQGEGL